MSLSSDFNEMFVTAFQAYNYIPNFFLSKSLVRDIVKFHILMANFAHFGAKMTKSVNLGNFGRL